MFVGDRKGFLFANKMEMTIASIQCPEAQPSSALGGPRHSKKWGFMLFVDIRATFLNAGTPDSLIRFWFGHSSGNRYG